MCISVFALNEGCIYDDELPWPIKKSFDIKLLNQISDTEHWVRSASFASATYKPIAERVSDDRETAVLGRGCFDFIDIEEICKITPTCKYLKDDCIIFTIERSSWYNLY